jgi:NAD(P)-dependent dehydrogenase (short-subunit alcohol dehydrogenase family)
MGFLAGKRLLITGVISNRSIAYGIANACKREGAELAFTYQGERIKDRVTDLAAGLGSNLVFPCDVSSDEQIAALFESLRQVRAARRYAAGATRLDRGRAHCREHRSHRPPEKPVVGAGLAGTTPLAARAA